MRLTKATLVSLSFLLGCAVPQEPTPDAPPGLRLTAFRLVHSEPRPIVAVAVCPGYPEHVVIGTGRRVALINVNASAVICESNVPADVPSLAWHRDMVYVGTSSGLALVQTWRVVAGTCVPGNSIRT